MTLNLGIVGPGNIADRELAPAIKETEETQLWSVTSRVETRAREFGEKYGAVAEKFAFGDYEEALGDPDLDAVVISVPDRLHAEYGIKAALAGKHVLLEKPLASSTQEARELINVCEKEGVTLGVAYHLRWHAGHRKLLNSVHDGAIGEVQHVRAHWSFKTEDDSNWRAHEEMGRWWGLAAVGTHCLDLIRWAALPSCGEVISVESTVTNNYWGSPHDETAMVNLKFESGATAELTTSVLFDSTPEFAIYGRDGSAVCRDTLGPHGGGEIKLLGDELAYVQENPYEGEIRDFALAIKEERQPEVSGEEGIRNVEILEQAA